MFPWFAALDAMQSQHSSHGMERGRLDKPRGPLLKLGQ